MSPAVFAIWGICSLVIMTIIPAIGFLMWSRGDGKPGQYLVRHSNGTTEWINPDDYDFEAVIVEIKE